MQPFRLGYVANCLTLGIGASHTTRLANATPERLEALIEQNLGELEQILLFNEAQGIEVYRSSPLPPTRSTGWSGGGPSAVPSSAAERSPRGRTSGSPSTPRLQVPHSPRPGRRCAPLQWRSCGTGRGSSISWARMPTGGSSSTWEGRHPIERPPWRAPIDSSARCRTMRAGGSPSNTTAGSGRPA